MSRRRKFKNGMARLSISIPKDLYEELWKYKQKYDLNVSHICRNAIKKALLTLPYEITTA